MFSGLENPLHLLLLLFLILLLVGARRLPGIGRSLGAGMREFTDSVTGRTAPSAEPEGPSRPGLPAGTNAAADAGGPRVQHSEQGSRPTD